MTAQKNVTGRSRSSTGEGESDVLASRFYLGFALILLAGTMTYNFISEIKGDRPASPERVAEVSQQMQATAWDECSVDYSLAYTPDTYIAEQLKTNQPIKNATLDYLLKKVDDCNNQRQQKMVDALNAKAQKAALN